MSMCPWGARCSASAIEYIEALGHALQRVGQGHRVGPAAAAEQAQRRRQPLQLGTAVLANGAQRGCGDDAPTIAHDFDEQRLTGWLLIVSDDAIAQVLARGCALAKHLLDSRPRSLAGRAFAPRP